MRPQRRQPTRLPRPWDSPGKNTEVGCHFFLQCMKVKSESELLSRVWPLATPWTAAYQAPPSLWFPRQEYWSGVPLPSPYILLRPSKNNHYFLLVKSNLRDVFSVKDQSDTLWTVQNYQSPWVVFFERELRVIALKAGRCIHHLPCPGENSFFLSSLITARLMCSYIDFLQ